MSRNSIGRRLVLSSFGESHGSSIGAVLDGCPAGLELGKDDIQPMLDLRRPGQSVISTQRKESDAAEIVSGVYRGRTTGAPITMMIKNSDQRSRDYDDLLTVPRPGHSDYPAMVKYGRLNDPRGGGRFSGRLTATHVLGGAVAKKLLRDTLKIATCAFTRQIGGIAIKSGFVESMRDHVYDNDVRCPDPDAARQMKEAILNARGRGDSLGGIIESVTTNVPVGLGEPIFGSLESDLSAAIFSIPSVKGVEFGSGFAGSALRGSENNDQYVPAKDGRLATQTNNSGGILGGLSNGMPIVMRAAFKPASSIAREQASVDVDTMEHAVLRVKGRHDPCVVPRAPPVVDSLVSLVLADHALTSGLIGQVI